MIYSLRVHVFVLHALLFPYRGGRMQAFRSTCKIDVADFIDWRCFLPSNLIKEISPHTEALCADTSSF